MHCYASSWIVKNCHEWSAVGVKAVRLDLKFWTIINILWWYEEENENEEDNKCDEDNEDKDNETTNKTNNKR